ncbi:hypothetical protein [Nitrobacter hamburgensis]|uniref:hypothetical protein n=1 Tax=Nitrobacter hamburgensis TaxID=912 RepID=UPI0002DAED9C|nr:hypothetical protein [Nitrobacter hamburgensis]
MSRFFIIVAMTGLMMLLTALLVWWFGFHTTEAPRVFLSLDHVEMERGYGEYLPRQ